MSHIDFHYKDKTPRECLRVVNNGWLYSHQIDKAREVAETGTDEECANYLVELQASANDSLEGWRMYQ